jgi:hypothetical protein
MPLHYHNQIVKEHTANPLLELAKPQLYHSSQVLSTPTKPFGKIIFSRRLLDARLNYIGHNTHGNPHQGFTIRSPTQST